PAAPYVYVIPNISTGMIAAIRLVGNYLACWGRIVLPFSSVQNVNIFLETHQGQKRMERIFLIHARAPYFRALCSFFAMVYWLILYWSLCVPVKQCAGVPHATALMFFILWVQYRVAVILFGLFVLSKLLKSHHRLVVVLFPSFPVSQDLNGTGKEDYHAFHFCVLTRQLHSI
ncbi:hypothetical protein BY39_12985, partial [Escherichia coli O104:H21 str. 94-3025]